MVRSSPAKGHCLLCTGTSQEVVNTSRLYLNACRLQMYMNNTPRAARQTKPRPRPPPPAAASCSTSRPCFWFAQNIETLGHDMMLTSAGWIASKKKSVRNHRVDVVACWCRRVAGLIIWCFVAFIFAQLWTGMIRRHSRDTALN